ncbi:MAG: DUF2163 domain-containing protein [Pseudomonadota bacterium]
MRIFFDRALDNVATIWRIYRRDGVTLGFTSHDRNLVFDGITHLAAPGMVPAAIRLTANLSDDSAEVEGVLSHRSILEKDLSSGLFDNATIEVGVVDWATFVNSILYYGKIGSVENDANSFAAELRSSKASLEQDLVPRTSPTCRAEFCGPQCGLSAQKFTSIEAVTTIDVDGNQVGFSNISGSNYTDGQVRFLDGPQTGIVFGIVTTIGGRLVLDRPLSADVKIGVKAELREGCDHTHTTCSNRFQNVLNFRGEPHLPGNDLLARYG